MDQVSAVLRDQFHLDGILVNNVETLSGWYLSARHDCSAEVARIRGNVDASGMGWRQIRYRIVRQDEAENPLVTVEMGDAVPLAGNLPSFWQRLLAYL